MDVAFMLYMYHTDLLKCILVALKISMTFNSKVQAVPILCINPAAPREV